MKVRNWILLIINTLVVFVVISISLSFYSEFSKVLDQRILLHLKSIKTLKRIQLQRLIEKEWNTFTYDNTEKENIFFKIPKDKFLKNGIYDLTHLHPENETSIGIIKYKNNQRFVNIVPYENVRQILLERTGMGSSGESYLVGNDFKMRSQSRFFPNTKPFKIKVETKGVKDALKTGRGQGIFPDYRGISVYSAYNKLNIGNLDWVILSEIDVEEIIIPLNKMRDKLVVLGLFTIIISIILSLFLTKVITKPINKIHNNILVMTKGNYESKLLLKNSPKEIIEIARALNDLKTMLSGAVTFSKEIGNMHLNTSYTPKSNSDVLGYSLLKMRDNLALYRQKEKQINLTTKKLLVESLENERSRLAKELHDGVGPLLTTLKIFVQNKISDTTQKDIMKKMIDDTITEVRQMTNVLRPATLDKFGLAEALFNYIEGVKKSTKIDILFEQSTKKEFSQLSKKQQINIFRIVQELLNNSIKHSKAKQIRITLSEFDEYLALYFFDDGIGFNPQKIKRGSGISNIKERVEILNGLITIKSKSKVSITEIEVPIKLKQ